MTVLIVDDQPDVVRGEQQGIDWEKLGIGRILTAYSVPEARELLLGERVDILLCDIEMPPHSGLFSLVHKRYSATIMASAMAKPAMNFKIIAPSISKSPL